MLYTFSTNTCRRASLSIQSGQHSLISATPTLCGYYDAQSESNVREMYEIKDDYVQDNFR